MDGCMKNAVVKIPVTSLYNMHSECEDNIAHSMAFIEICEEALKGVDTSY